MKKSLKFMTAITLASITSSLMTTPITYAVDNMNTGWVERSREEVKASIEEALNKKSLYIIQSGDTLGKIADVLSVDLTTLVALNAIKNPDLIIAGAFLYLDPESQTLTYSESNGDNAESVSLETNEIVDTTQVPDEAMNLVNITQTEGYLQETYYNEVSFAQPTTTIAEPVVAETTFAPNYTQDVVTSTETVAQEVQNVETTQSFSAETEISQETTSSFVDTTVTTEQLAETVIEFTQVPTETVESTVVETTVAPTTTTVAETTQAPTTTVAETTQAPTTTTTVIETTTVAPVSGTNAYGGIQSDAKEWIAQKESGGSYTVYSPSGNHYGRYQLMLSYLNGDLSPENQERVADQYVLNRYGSWEAAKTFWLANNWY